MSDTNEPRNAGKERAERVAEYYRTLVANGVPEQLAGELALDYQRETLGVILGQIRQRCGVRESVQA